MEDVLFNVSKLIEIVRRAQQRLRKIDEVLIRMHVALIDSDNHRLYYQAWSQMPIAIIEKVIVWDSPLLSYRKSYTCG